MQDFNPVWVVPVLALTLASLVGFNAADITLLVLGVVIGLISFAESQG